MIFMGTGLTVIVTANVVLTTLGLFEHKVFHNAGNSTLRLIEAGNGRTDLAVFTMEGKRKLFEDEEHSPIPSILFREENNVKHYISLKSENSKLMTTTDRNLATTFLVKSMDTRGEIFSMQYKDKETETTLCLQGAFPTNNSQIIYHKVHAKVGNCYERRHKDTHIIPLVARIPDKKDPKCL